MKDGFSHSLDLLGVARIFRQVITDLDRVFAIDGIQFDHDVQRFGCFALAWFGVWICFGVWTGGEPKVVRKVRADAWQDEGCGERE